MHDSVGLEQRGVATAVVITAEFELEARMQRDALGMSSLSPVLIEHPLSTLTDEQIDARAEAAVAGAKVVWLGGK